MLTNFNSVKERHNAVLIFRVENTELAARFALHNVEVCKVHYFIDGSPCPKARDCEYLADSENS